MRAFDIPNYYRSSFISTIKNLRKDADSRKKDFTPTLLDFGGIQFLIPRHFGFCFGVENAIEIAYKAVSENPGKNIYLLSQMIHNPIVNKDLQDKGIQFIMDTEGNQFVDWDVITKDDIIIPTHCPILNTPLISHAPRGTHRKSVASLDRIDPTKGYTKDNIEVISHLANTMKSDASKEDLLSFSTTMINRYGS